MEKRKLGKSGIQVQPLMFGGNVFGWTADEPTSFKLLDAFVDEGFDFIDTADMYSTWAPGHIGGESETVIGNWLKKSGKRNQVVIATKVGKDMGSGRKGLSKNYLIRAVEDSLKRLQTDYIDLYQSHEDDRQTPLAETLQTYADLIKQGKVRAIGASNYTAPRLAEALAVSESLQIPSYQSMQPEYNLYAREGYEKEMEPLCFKEGIGVITYFSLASGFLTGKYRSESDFGKSTRGSGMLKYLNPRGFRILDALDQVSAQYQATPASISLAWLMARPGITAPIASATSVAQLKELTKAAQINLSIEAIYLLNTASAY